MEAIASLMRPSIADSKPTVILSYLMRAFSDALQPIGIFCALALFYTYSIARSNISTNRMMELSGSTLNSFGSGYPVPKSFILSGRKMVAILSFIAEDKTSVTF
jgi:hypothetical protein